MNDFEKTYLSRFGEKNLSKIQSAKIGIAGAGGLGSNCAFNLVRTGFRKLTVIDFDTIDLSNLNRQFYFYDQVGLPKVKALEQNLKRINPDLEGRFLEKKIEADNILELFSDCDIVVEAFDRPEYKSLFVEKLLNTQKFLVCASGLAGWGNSDAITVRQVKDNLVMIGDLVSDFSLSAPLSPRVNIAAAKQADEILNFVLRRSIPFID